MYVGYGKSGRLPGRCREPWHRAMHVHRLRADQAVAAEVLRVLKPPVKDDLPMRQVIDFPRFMILATAAR
jgi:hypothetical protein